VDEYLAEKCLSPSGERLGEEASAVGSALTLTLSQRERESSQS